MVTRLLVSARDYGLSWLCSNIISAAMPSDVRKAFGLPTDLAWGLGLRPAFWGAARDPDEAERKRRALPHIRRQSRGYAFSKNEKGRKVEPPAALFVLVSCLAFASSTGPSCSVAQNSQFYRSSTKPHCFTGARCPDVDSFTANCSAGVSDEIFTAVTRVIESDASPER